ncbi:MAG: M20 family metallopeptidase [Verrucomicrobiae bacterium]|nr:M20 family metallopeptidase [Verrucomicrobiae bacterium]
MSPVLETLAALVRINSVNPEWGGPGEKEMVAHLERSFAEVDLETITEEVLPGRSNLIVRVPGRDPHRCVLLEAHLDTVSVADMTIPPFDPVISDGRLFGRGACDVKGGLAAMMQAVRDLAESGTPPPCEVIFAAVIDEEHHYRGVTALIEWLRRRGRPLPEAAVVAEPTELRVVRANKGVLRFRVITRGKSAHSAKPHLGRNAIVAMAPVIELLDREAARLARESDHPLLGPATLSIGVIEGGAQVNFVPEHCAVSIDRRLLPGESGEFVLDHLENLLGELRADHPDLEVEIERPPQLVDEAMETPVDSPVVATASAVLKNLGENAEPVGVPFGCDCTKLSRAGIPSVIFGPGSIDQAHGAVEFVETAQVEKAVEFYRDFVFNFGS